MKNTTGFTCSAMYVNPPERVTQLSFSLTLYLITGADGNFTGTVENKYRLQAT